MLATILLPQAPRPAPVQQDGAARAQEADGPARDEDGADDAHGGIHPGEPQVLGAEQGHDGQDRGERVGEHVEIRGAEVVVVVRVLVARAPRRRRARARPGRRSG